MPDGYSEQPKSDDLNQAATWIDADAWDEASIPPRPWIAPGYFLRGAVTVVVGAGGVSKSALMVAYSTALVLGRDYHGMKPLDAYKVISFNVEDDRYEQQRRLSAVLNHMGSTPAAIAGRLHRFGPERTGLLLARNDAGALRPTGAMQDLKDAIVAVRPDVVILDPFVELHSEEENNNQALREVVAEMRAIAKEYNLALVLVHHTRKGPVMAGDADAARGASAIVGAARVVLTVTGMSKEEEEALNLPAGSRTHYLRVDGAKSNYAPLTQAQWFQRISVELLNGDRVPVLEPWAPPHDQLTDETLERLRTIIERGSPEGPWSTQIGNRPRSVKHAMVETGIVTEPGQRAMLQMLFAKGYTETRFTGRDRKEAKGIRSPNGKPSNVAWLDEMPSSDDE